MMVVESPQNVGTKRLQGSGASSGVHNAKVLQLGSNPLEFRSTQTSAVGQGSVWRRYPNDQTTISVPWHCCARSSSLKSTGHAGSGMGSRAQNALEPLGAAAQNKLPHGFAAHAKRRPASPERVAVQFMAVLPSHHPEGPRQRSPSAHEVSKSTSPPVRARLPSPRSKHILRNAAIKTVCLWPKRLRMAHERVVRAESIEKPPRYTIDLPSAESTVHALGDYYGISLAVGNGS